MISLIHNPCKWVFLIVRWYCSSAELFIVFRWWTLLLRMDLMGTILAPTVLRAMDPVLPRLPALGDRAPTLPRRARGQRLPPVYQSLPSPKIPIDSATPTPNKKQLVDERLKLYEISGTWIFWCVFLNLKWHSRNNNLALFWSFKLREKDDKWMECYQTHTRSPYILKKKKDPTNIAKHG
jgi:hypothetical protein